MRIQPRTRTPKRREILAACAGLLLVVASRSEALPVTHEFTGIVEFVSPGGPGFIDLTGTFSNGQALSLSYTIERATPPVSSDPNIAIYFGAVTAMTYTIGSYSGALGPASATVAEVGNDVPQGGAARWIGPRHPSGTLPDVYILTLTSPDAPPVNGGVPFDFQFVLNDVEGTAWSSTGIPGLLPDLAEFEDKLWNLSFSSGSNVGLVQGSFQSASTPVRPASWGRLKSQYRD